MEESYPVRTHQPPAVLSIITHYPIQVQLQTLTSVVKLFLRKPETSQGLVQKVLNTATKDCDSPDVRDRAYIYWRLLSTDPGAAKVWALVEDVFSRSHGLLGCNFGSQAANIYPENEHFPGTFG